MIGIGASVGGSILAQRGIPMFRLIGAQVPTGSTCGGCQNAECVRDCDGQKMWFCASALTKTPALQAGFVRHDASACMYFSMKS